MYGRNILSDMAGKISALRAFQSGDMSDDATLAFLSTDVTPTSIAEFACEAAGSADA